MGSLGLGRKGTWLGVWGGKGEGEGGRGRQWGLVSMVIMEGQEEDQEKGQDRYSKSVHLSKVFDKCESYFR